MLHVKDHDMRGFVAGTALLIQLNNLTAVDGSAMPISRASLSIETPVSMEKTGIRTFPMV